MSLKPLKVGLIGTGGYGTFHFNSLHDLQAQGKVEIAAVADPTLDRQHEMRERLKTLNIPAYASDEAMRENRPDLDFVVIASPIPLHDEMTRRWLETNAWIYLEKPPVPTIQQLKELIALDKEKRVRVGFQLIHMRPLRRLKEWILEGRLGEIRRISVIALWPRLEAYYRRNNWAAKLIANGRPTFDGPATNALSHIVHNVAFLAGSQMDSFATPESVSGEFYRARKIESYDLAILNGAFPQGAVFDIGLAHCVNHPVQPKLRVEGTKASAELDQSSFLLTCSDGSKENSDAQVQNESKRTLYNVFLSQVRRDSPTAASTLENCVPYSLMTCGGLIASGKIHTIPEEFKSSFGVDEASGVQVDGLHKAMLRLGETGEGLADQHIPWANKSIAVSAAEVHHLDLAAFV